MVEIMFLGCIALVVLGMRFFPTTGWTVMLLVYVWTNVPTELVNETIKTGARVGENGLTVLGGAGTLVTLVLVVFAISIDWFRNGDRRYDLDDL